MEGSAALIILAFSAILDISTGICGSIIDMTGYTKLKMFNSTIRVIILVSSNLILIPRFGLIGAATASLLGISVLNIMRMVQVWIIFNLIPYNRSFIKPLFGGIIAILLTWSLIQLFPPYTNLLLAGAEGVLGCSIYVGLIILLGISSEERTILRKIKSRMISSIIQSRTAIKKRLIKGSEK
jgi:O-antigen/teichoic acid export membrane protein